MRTCRTCGAQYTGWGCPECRSKRGKKRYRYKSTGGGRWARYRPLSGIGLGGPTYEGDSEGEPEGEPDPVDDAC